MFIYLDLGESVPELPEVQPVLEELTPGVSESILEKIHRFYPLPMAPGGLMEAIDGRPLPVSSVG